MSIETILDTTQYLTFKLGEEVFALDVAKVREILERAISPRCRRRLASCEGLSTCGAAWCR